MSVVLAIDPGKLSGVCIYDPNEQKLLVSRIIVGGLEGIQAFFKEYEEEGPDWDVIVCESFELEEGSHGIDYESPLQIIHWLKEREPGWRIVWQRRMQRGKNSVASVKVLKRAGLYPPRGQVREGHQIAALQHALAFLIKQRHMPTIALLHPKEG